MDGNHLSRTLLRLIAGLLIIPLLLASGALQAAQYAAADLSSADELEAFIDPIIAEQMEEYNIPGVAFVMVRDGEILLSKGYGVVEQDSDEPIDPDHTIFDVGSVAKLFTATAVMQQVEAGNLDLDADVSQYVPDIDIPDNYDEPITLRHVMTHTPGFDERLYLGMIAPGPDEIQPLDENLQEHMPPRIRPPGEINQYSNTGMTIAGHAVEEVSGESYADYITNHIFAPLGMERSTYDYPESLIPEMAIGHESTFGQTTPVEIWHLNDRPAGGLRSTPHDIAQFMIAHLEEGGDILEPATVDEMHATHFRAHEGISGSAIGFIEHQVGDRRGLHHGGQWIGFSSLLYLLPDEDTGIFVAANNGSAIYTQFLLIEAILDEYFPVDPPGPTAETSGADVSGTYRWNRIDHHTFLQLMSVAAAHTLTVEDHGDGTISTEMSPALLPDATWIEIEPGVFQEEGGTNRLGFDTTNDGDSTSVHLAWPLLMTLDRIAWHQSAGLHLTLLGFFLLSLLTVIAWPVSRLYRRIRGRTTELEPDHARARLTAGTIAGLIYAFLIGTLLLVATNTAGFFQVPTIFKALLWFPIIAAVLTIPLLVFVVRLWMENEAPVGSRIHLSLIAVAMVGFVPFLWYWNILGFNY